MSRLGTTRSDADERAASPDEDQPDIAGNVAPAPDASRSGRRPLVALLSSRRAVALGAAVLAAVPRLATAPASFITADEPLWMQRSGGFYEALVTGDLGGATAGRDATGLITMPGVTTMWVGVIARGIWALGQGLGVWTDDADSFATSALGLDVAQVVMALVTSAVIGLLVVLVAVWAGRGAAVVTGIVLATEPFFVAHGAVLHTDELSALLGVASLVATAILLGLPAAKQWTGRRWLAVFAGALLAGSWLTKVSALMFLPSVALLVLWAAARRRADSDNQYSWVGALWSFRGVAGRWLVGGAVLLVLTYPALWANPFNELPDIITSAGQSVRDHDTYFLGEARTNAGPAFYLVALPLRLTPWFLVLGAVSGVAVLLRPATRPSGLVTLCMAMPPFLVLSFGTQKFDRYALSVLVVGAIVVGLASTPVFAALRRRWSSRDRLLAATAGLVAAGLTVHVLLIAPWNMSYFNPALGGSTSGERAITLGWGQGVEEAVEIIEDSEGGVCDGVEIWMAKWTRDHLDYWECGTATGSSEEASYVIVYVNERQRMDDDQRAELVEGRDHLGDVRIRGATYAEVFGTLAED